MTTTKTPAYYAGYEDMRAHIAGMGFETARNKFNLENPPGQKWTGSAEGLAYANGEFQALCDAKGI